MFFAVHGKRLYICHFLRRRCHKITLFLIFLDGTAAATIYLQIINVFVIYYFFPHRVLRAIFQFSEPEQADCLSFRHGSKC